MAGIGVIASDRSIGTRGPAVVVAGEVIVIGPGCRMALFDLVSLVVAPFCNRRRDYQEACKRGEEPSHEGPEDHGKNVMRANGPVQLRPSPA